MENNTEILIFEYIDIAFIRKNYDKFIIGHVINRIESPNGGVLYEVLGTDEKIYQASHKFPKDGVPYYIRTKEEHIQCLNEYVEGNQETIIELTTENNNIENLISELNQKEHHKTL